MRLDRDEHGRTARARLGRRRLAAAATGLLLAAAGAAVALVLTGRSSSVPSALTRRVAPTRTRARITPAVPTTTAVQPTLSAPATTAEQPPVPTSTAITETTTAATTFSTVSRLPLLGSVLALMRRYRGTEMSVFPTTQRVVLLTFDGGANAGGAPSILRTLRRFGIGATFFLTGRWVELYPMLARRIVRGYPIANHTYDHRALTGLADRSVRQEIDQAQALIRQVTGRDPVALFRFPYGATDSRLIAIANQLGYVSVRWTVDTLGWEGTALHRTAGSVVQRVVAGLQPGEIVLMHLGSAPDGSTLDADALPTVIQEVEKRGYRFATLVPAQ